MLATRDVLSSNFEQEACILGRCTDLCERIVATRTLCTGSILALVSEVGSTRHNLKSKAALGTHRDRTCGHCSFSPVCSVSHRSVAPMLEI